jgi:glycosyltransferase involved in cell wall biosynthesis
MAPRVSVIINCLNGEKYVRDAIESALNQTYENREIVFWDNASTDGTAAIARSFGEKLRYFRGLETVPLGKARNAALAASTGEIIAFLDADDLWLPSKLEKQIPLFDDPKVGLVFTDAIYFNDAGKEKRLYGTRAPSTGHVFRALLTGYELCLSTTAIRRRTLDNLSEWFDDRFEMTEEADLFRRIALSWEFAYVAEALTRYRVHASSTTWRKMWLAPFETELMLEKFKTIYPGFEQTYASEVAQLRTQIEYGYARYDMFRGERSSARQRLGPVKKRSWRCLALYLLTFFPTRIYHTLLGFRSVVPAER